MSHRLIDRSPGLLALRNAGYNLEIRGGFILLKDVPYVSAAGAVREDGILISSLETVAIDGQLVANEPPQDHVCRWTGEHPHHSDGRKVTSFENPSLPQDMGSGIQADFTFSAKAPYRDYDQKFRAYLGWIEGEAKKLEERVTARTYPVYATSEEDDDVFNYVDTASSRVHIGADNDKLAGHRLAIVGVGGTGSYVLDLVAKTRVEEIHIFDGDSFEPHNAFRAPGAWSLAELGARESKVDAMARVYGKLRRRGLIPHNERLTAENLAAISDVDFVFLCLDEGRAKRAIVEDLVARGTPFVDVGMGIVRTPNGLQGVVRTVTSTVHKRDHIERRMTFGDDDEAINEYATNIQIAELNALNAAFAVIRWKKLLGFYRDAGREHSSVYQVATGDLANEEIQ